MDMSKYMGLTPCASLQQQYSLLNRELELELVDVCTNENVAVLPWSPLKGVRFTYLKLIFNTVQLTWNRSCNSIQQLIEMKVFFQGDNVIIDKAIIGKMWIPVE